jgi:uncharacterized DUF497 family protein
MTFEWDEIKNQENIKKHSVSFETAQEAFFDMEHIIIKVIYTEAPQTVSKAIIEGEIIVDFLPLTKELVRKENKVKIPITVEDKAFADVF